MSQKRDAERVPLSGEVTGEVTVYEPMTILDMSELGAQIETRFAMQLDSLHEFRLTLGTRSVIVKGRIVHCQNGELSGGGALYRTGVEFIEPSEHALMAIHAFIEAKKTFAEAPPAIVEAEITDEGN
jgi:hypothetical protein